MPGRTDIPPTDAAWTDGDLADPHAAADKAGRVRRMFSAIAPSYDLNNRLHSLWRDQAWRRKAVKLATVKPGDVVLDVACGTGDLALAFAAGKPAPDRVIGLDFTFEMLAIAQRKPPRRRHDGAPVPMHWINGDAMALPVPAAAADVVSIAFGIRNVADPARAIAEFYRVLRPAGRLVILEFSLPTNRLMRGLYHFYFNHVMPRTATLIARDRSGAYKYLPRSVNTFIDRARMMQMMRDAGFTDVTATPLTFGVAVVYRGVK
jgi:demethylmenaquinone methyltransferase/2-methoxy-6-polyprenyl-1,4-benzoquinol methylase